MASKVPFREPALVVDDFLPTEVALEMRRKVEQHFRDPYTHKPQSHMTWNYWFVPDMYTYLRTELKAILGRDLAENFHAALTQWSIGKLGLSHVTPPTMSLYVDGCRQGVHNDTGNGRFGFVYSLTKDDRRTSGGETLIWREQDYYGEALHRRQAGQNFYQVVEPRFNRLVLFDDRLPHAVQVVEGVMDPCEGRVVLHGHIYEGELLIEGGRNVEEFRRVVEQEVERFSASLGESLMLFHGPVVLRLAVDATGTVASLEVALDRLKRLAGEGPPADEVLRNLVLTMKQLRFPAGAGERLVNVTVPLGFGNRLAELR